MFGGTEKYDYLRGRKYKNIKILATSIRAIPTLYGVTAEQFEREAARTESNPETQDYRHEAKVVAEFLKNTNVL